ncbi:hypothetical protein [Streptomyces sp. NPDC005093]
MSEVTNYENKDFRRVLCEEEWQAVVKAVRSVDPYGTSTLALDHATAALSAVGILSPSPTPEPGTCTALYPDDIGDWLQCQEEPHDGKDHDSGEWGWSDNSPNSIPPRRETRRVSDAG